MNAKTETNFDTSLPDAVFDLDGTVFKFTVLEQFILWLCAQGIFSRLPDSIESARLAWKRDGNTEASYKTHLSMLVEFFIGEIAQKETSVLHHAAAIVASQTSYRQWDVTRNLIAELSKTHNVISISLMPEWLMPPFVRELGFVATLGSTYVERDGQFTGEAHSIDKAEVYAAFRSDDLSHLDVAMGDTTGDISIFSIAQRPIAFNPSFTLVGELKKWMTIVAAWKDMVFVTNLDEARGSRSVKQLHCSRADEVLKLIRSNPT